MSRSWIIAVVVVLVIAVTAGCAKKHTTYYGPGGKVTVSEKGGKAKKVEVKTADGKATVEVGKKVSEKELGVPIYTGADVETSGDYEGGSGDKTEKMQQCILTTSDDFDKVCEFYKSKLKNIENSLNQTTDKGKMAMFSAKGDDGEDIAVNITTDEEKKVTKIHIIKVQKPKQ